MQLCDEKKLVRMLVAQVYGRFKPRLCRALAKRYPGVARAHIEDAVADAFADVLERPSCLCSAWQRGGECDLYRLLHCIARRHLRGRLRKKSARCEILGLIGHESARGPTPEGIIAGQQVIGRVHRLADRAAQRFGGSRPEALRAALTTRFGGANDSEAARTHGVPREYVNRARRWIGAQMSSQSGAISASIWQSRRRGEPSP